MTYKFPNSSRLRHRYEFRRFARDSQCRVGQCVIVEFRAGRSLQPKLGITVTRKYGKSHDRNRFKRIVREAFRLIQNQIKDGVEVHIKPRSGAYDASMGDIQRELLALIPPKVTPPKTSLLA